MITTCFISNQTTHPVLAPDGDDAGREGVDEAGQVVEVVAVHRLVVSWSYLLLKQFN